MNPFPKNDPPPQARKKRKKIVRKDTRSPDYVREKMASPEMTAKRLEALRKWREANPGMGHRAKGQPDGVRKKDWLIIKAKAAKKAEKVIQKMTELKMFQADNDVAHKALQAAIEILVAPGESRNRLAAAKVLLEYTQTKPLVKNETTLKTAEDFLASIIEEE